LSLPRRLEKKFDEDGNVERSQVKTQPYIALSLLLFAAARAPADPSGQAGHSLRSDADILPSTASSDLFSADFTQNSVSPWRAPAREVNRLRDRPLGEPPGLGDLDGLSGIPVTRDTRPTDKSGPSIKSSESPVGASSLAASALLGMGAWQLARRALALPFGHLPAWYHADARQIGHSLAIDPLLCSDVLFLCRFEAPSGQDWRPNLLGTSRQPEAWCESQFCLSVSAPRGPPNPSR
jgi:hypothetical protein